MILFLLFLGIFDNSFIFKRVDAQSDKLQLFSGHILKKFKEVIPNVEDRWNEYKSSKNLILTEKEEKDSFFVYGKHLLFIEECKTDDLFPFEVAENDFMHKSRVEYFSLLGLIENENSENDYSSNEVFTRQTIINKTLEIGTIDWRTKNIVTPVKDQKDCGSCYAFSTIASFEAAIAKKTGKQYDLSEQYLIDCSTAFGNHLCNGGKVSGSFTYLMQNSIPNEGQYPYKAMNETCKTMAGISPKLTNFQRISMYDELDLSKKVLTIGPVSAGIDARRDTFKFYKSGIYSDPSCSNTSVNHGISVVGIQDSPSPYYIIKNSWSTTWGMSGYVQLARYSQNQCGVATQAIVPIF